MLKVESVCHANAVRGGHDDVGITRWRGGPPLAVAEAADARCVTGRADICELGRD